MPLDMGKLRFGPAVEVRFAQGDEGAIEGYAAVFGKSDSFGDVIAPGAFAASLAQHRAANTRPLLLWSHNVDQPIGIWDAIEEDRRGLKVSGRLVLDSTGGRDAHALLKAGAMDGLSIGFMTKKATMLPNGGRRVEAMDLIEVSIVARPAQGAARVISVKSAAHAVPDAAGLAAFIRQCAARVGVTKR